MTSLRCSVVLLAALCALPGVGCSAEESGGGGRGGGGRGGSGGGAATSGSAGSAGSFGNSMATPSGPTGPAEPFDPMHCVPRGDNGDADGDGFTPATGDCEDCSPQIGPAAFDFPGNSVDEDCRNGDAPLTDVECDSGIAIDTMEAMDGARAIGLCKTTTEDSGEWGVISATWVQADGTPMLPNPAQKGVLPNFGSMITPHQGASMLGLSSGSARATDQPGYTPECDNYTALGPPAATGGMYKAPEGYPKESPACPGVISGAVFDPAGLELRIRVPSNASSFHFESNFLTYEYPQYICTPYNDFFVALLDPKPPELPDANIAFDQDMNPISVNNSLLQVCDPGTYGGKMFTCPLGAGMLTGTSFDGGAPCAGAIPKEFTDLFGMIFPIPLPPAPTTKNAATGWLMTSAPSEAGTIITLRFAIWDSGDGILDSVVLIDKFEWSPDKPEIKTVPVVVL